MCINYIGLISLMSRKLLVVNNHIKVSYKYSFIDIVVYINDDDGVKEYFFFIVHYMYPHIVMLYVVDLGTHYLGDRGSHGNR